MTPGNSSTLGRPALDGLMDTEGLSNYLGVPESWVYRRTAKGHPDPLPFVKVGGLLRFRPSEIEAWLEAHRGIEVRHAS